MLWLLETGVYGETHPLASYAIAQGQNVIMRDSFKRLGPIQGPVIFHGSMNTARELCRADAYYPGSACDEESHTVTHVTRQLGPLALNDVHVLTTVRELIHAPVGIASLLGRSEAFVRPNSPLKHFSGRTIELDAALQPEDLDFGIYFEDFDLPIIVAPPKEIKEEWRVVVRGQEPIAIAPYDAKTRRSSFSANRPHEAWQFAFEAASRIQPKDWIYMLDVCLTPQGFRVVETNPFSGSDLYGMERAVIANIKDTWGSRS